MHNEGWGYSIWLVVIICLAFTLRFLNLTILDPYTDEYAHLVAAKDLIETGGTEYTRAFLVTFLTKLSYQIGNADNFYEYLFWGRLPGVIFSSLTIIPLYFLAKKINKPTAIISIILFATSPWAIGVAKNIREYAFYPLFVLIGILIIIKIFELIKDFKPKQRFQIAILSTILLAFFYYAYKIDTLSTLKISFLILPITAGYLAIPNIKKFLKTRKIKILTTFFIFCIISILLYFSINNPHITLTPEATIGWFNYFFSTTGSPMHWWYENSINYLVYFLMILGFIYAYFKKKNAYFLYFCIFTALIIFYVFFFDRYIRPRYIYYALPFFTILISTGLYGIISLIQENSEQIKKYLLASIFIFFVLAVFNIQNIIYAVTDDSHGYVRTTNEHHDRVYNSIDFLKHYGVSEKDAFVTTIFGHILKLEFDATEESLYQFRYRDEERFDKVREVVNSNPQGFIILDWRRNGHWAEGYPKEGSFKIGEQKINVLQNKDGIQIYRWERTNQ